jgi:hypothetical protein
VSFAGQILLNLLLVGCLDRRLECFDALANVSLLGELLEFDFRLRLSLFEREISCLDHQHFLGHHVIVECHWVFFDRLVVDGLVLHVVSFAVDRVEERAAIVSHFEALPVLKLFERHQ